MKGGAATGSNAKKPATATGKQGSRPQKVKAIGGDTAGNPAEVNNTT